MDPAIFGPEPLAVNRVPRYIDSGRDIRRHCEHEIVRGLYISLYRESKLRGLTHWYAVMARGLYIVLKRWGVIFEQIGPARDYHGVRAPYLIKIESMEHTLSKQNPVFLQDLQNSLMDLDQRSASQ
jgi:N-acyl amino acid synthase of PEP-CTERM/exosortase system